jgi:hypothetical protein
MNAGQDGEHEEKERDEPVEQGGPSEGGVSGQHQESKRR